MSMRPMIVVQNEYELVQRIGDEMDAHGPNCDLNHLDVSRVTNFDNVFNASRFNGDISKWDVSNATTMKSMFMNSPFTGDLSQWSVANVVNMAAMFARSTFNGDISAWNVGSLYDSTNMFSLSLFNGDLSRWRPTKLCDASCMFAYSHFSGDVSDWGALDLAKASHMFQTPHFHGNLSTWQMHSYCEITEMVHEQFNGRLPRPRTADNSTDYAAMFGSDHALNAYAARTPFSQVHADLFLWNASQCEEWASSQTLAWTNETIAMGMALGLERSAIRALLVDSVPHVDLGVGIDTRVFDSEP